jgi:hypothetical protein
MVHMGNEENIRKTYSQFVDKQTDGINGRHNDLLFTSAAQRKPFSLFCALFLTFTIGRLHTQSFAFSMQKKESAVADSFFMK